MAVINRYSDTIKGAMRVVGNALSLCSSGVNVDKLTTAIIPPPNGGSTTVYTSDSNSIFVTIPQSGTLVRAELTWVGLIPGANTAIAFTITDPNSITSAITPLAATGQTDGSNYSNTFDATTIVKQGGNGKYTVNSIPFNIGGSGSGYALILVYKDSTEPYRNFNIWSVFNYQNTNFSVSGFATPTSGPVHGRIVVSSSGGNSNQSGDSLQMGQTLATSAILSGPNNPPNNFFASQVNNYQGILDTTGTWGNANVPVGGTLSQGDRAYYDVTEIDASSGLTNNITSVNIYLRSSGDAYVVGAVGLEIDVNSANNTLLKTVDKVLTYSGDTLTYTVTINNSGTASSIRNTIYDTIPNTVTYVPNSLFVNGVITSGDLSNGITIPDIGINGVATIVYQVTVNNGVNIGTTIPNKMLLDYSFVSISSLPTIVDSQYSNEVISTIFEDTVTIVKTVNTDFASLGDTLTYSIIVDNSQSILPLLNTYFIDTLPSSVNYVANSLEVNGVNYNIPSLSSPVLIYTLPGNSLSTITFNAVVGATVGSIVNSSNLNYSLFVNSSTTPFTKISNSVVTTISYSNPIINKYVSSEYTTSGNTISYTVSILNSGNVDLFNCEFIDTIPNGTVFISNSLMINNTISTQSLPSILLNTIAVGNYVTISYILKVL
ncbi:MAG: hypothetical protein ACRC7N_11170 [Clostridium sp.]